MEDDKTWGAFSSSQYICYTYRYVPAELAQFFCSVRNAVVDFIIDLELKAFILRLTFSMKVGNIQKCSKEPIIITPASKVFGV